MRLNLWRLWWSWISSLYLQSGLPLPPPLVPCVPYSFPFGTDVHSCLSALEQIFPQGRSSRGHCRVNTDTQPIKWMAVTLLCITLASFRPVINLRSDPSVRLHWSIVVWLVPSQVMLQAFTPFTNVFLHIKIRNPDTAGPSKNRRQ